ncbi:MAG: hypothetical protein DRP94_02610 [Candidatus Latescibacterota bacterium]|nr:MAG: hypothetical protein DRP94_02610 [Candidatus Latescibacterota bacterium]
MRRGLLLLLSLGCAAPATRTPQGQFLKLQQEVEELKARREEDPVAMRGIAELKAELDSLRAGQEELRKYQRSIDNKVALLEDQMARLEERMKRFGSPATKEVAPHPGEYETESAYKAALQDYRDRKYEQAIGEFSEILAVAPESEWADNAQYWIGECYYGLGNYEQALKEFEKVLSYPESEKDDDASFKIALCYIKLGDDGRAREALRKFLVDYPESEYVPRALKLLEELR